MLEHTKSIIAVTFILSSLGCGNKDGGENKNSPPIEPSNKIEIHAIGIGSGMAYNPLYEGGVFEADFEFVNNGKDYNGYWFTHTVRLFKLIGSDYVEFRNQLAIVTLADGSPIPGLIWKSGEHKLYIFDKFQVQGEGKYKYVITLLTPSGAVETDTADNVIEYEFEVIKYPSVGG